MDFINEPAEDEDEAFVQKDDIQADATEIKERKEELPPGEYIAAKKSEFFEQNKGKLNFEDEWNKLRSQLNSGLMLGISQKNIDKYATLNYTYEQREMIKFAMFTEASADVLARMMPKKTWREMLAELDASKVGHVVTDLVDKPLNAISQTLESYINSFNSFRSETEARKTEYENRIRELETLLADRAEEINLLQRKIEETEKADMEEQERARKEAETESRIEKLARKRFDKFVAEQEQREYERKQIREDIYRQIEDKYGPLDSFQPVNGSFTGRRRTEKSFFGRWGRRRRKDLDVSEQLSVRRGFKVQKIPANFNLSAYMMSADLSSSQMEIITLAVKTGVDDSIIKQMIDSHLPAQQLKQVLEVVLARTTEGGIAEKEDTYGKK